MNKLVDLIRARYPEERIADSKDALAHAWKREYGKRIPFLFGGGLLPRDPREFETMWFLINKPEDVLEYQLRHILDRAELEDDYVPMLSVHSRDGDLAVAFPGVHEVLYNDVFWIRSRLSDMRAVYSFSKPDYTRAYSTRHILEYIRYFRKETGGHLPIAASSIPGPAVMAGHIVGFERMMTEFFDHPDEIKYLIDLCTDCIIDMVELEMEAAEGCLSSVSNMPVWMPMEAGLFLNEDTIQALSPRIITAFFKESYERIAERFGGVVLHSCGYWAHAIRTTAGFKGVIGFQAGLNETPPDVQLNAIAGSVEKVVLNIHALSPPAVSAEGEAYETPSALKMATEILPGLARKGVFTCTLARTDGMTLGEANGVARMAKRIELSPPGSRTSTGG